MNSRAISHCTKAGINVVEWNISRRRSGDGILMCVILWHRTWDERHRKRIKWNGNLHKFFRNTVSSITHCTSENSMNAFRWSAFRDCLRMLKIELLRTSIPAPLHIHLHLLNVVIFIMRFFFYFLFFWLLTRSPTRLFTQNKRFVATCSRCGQNYNNSINSKFVNKYYNVIGWLTPIKLLDVERCKWFRLDAGGEQVNC